MQHQNLRVHKKKTTLKLAIWYNMKSKTKLADIPVISSRNTQVGKRGISKAISALEIMNLLRIQTCPPATQYRAYKPKNFQTFLIKLV